MKKIKYGNTNTFYIPGLYISSGTGILCTQTGKNHVIIGKRPIDSNIIDELMPRGISNIFSLQIAG